MHRQSFFDWKDTITIGQTKIDRKKPIYYTEARFVKKAKSVQKEGPMFIYEYICIFEWKGRHKDMIKMIANGIVEQMEIE